VLGGKSFKKESKDEKGGLGKNTTPEKKKEEKKS